MRARPALLLVLLSVFALAACTSGLSARHQPGRHSTAQAVAEEGARERFDKPEAAAEFWAMKRGITSGTDAAALYRSAEAHRRAMPGYSTVADALVEGGGRRAIASSVSQRTILSSWTFLGPGNIGGRTRVLAFDPADSNVMYSGGVSGGIWKSTNGGASWTPIGDELVNLAINSMVIDPKDGRTLYVGTGEGYFREDVRGTALPLRGDGIFVTHDGGQSWVQLAFTASNPDFQWVNDLAISPHDSARIYAATRSGVWRSDDAGVTWKKILATTVKGGALDLAMRGDIAGDYLFASCGVFEQATVYRNEHAESDGGWTAVLSEPGMSRTSLAIAPSNPSIVYALAASNDPGPDGSTQNLLAVFRSDSNGDPGTWTAQVRVTDAERLNTVILSNPIAAMSPQCFGGGASDWVPMGWHCNVIAVDPTNPDVVWAAGVDLFRSDDGGRSWGLASYWWTDQRQEWVHSDQHVIAFDPKYDGAADQRLFVTNDGGVFRTDNANAAVARGSNAPCSPSAAVRWTSLVHSYGTTQFYHGAVSPDGRSFAAGAQDNGVSIGNIATTVNDWHPIGGGDGGYVAFDPLSPTIVYTESQFGAVSWYDLTAGQEHPVHLPNAGDPGSFLFVTPLALDPNQHTRLWVGGSQMWRCDNAQAAYCSAASTLLQSKISAFAVSTASSEVVVAGTADGSILRTDRATSATSQTTWPSTMPRTGYVSSIVFDPFVATTLYASYAGFGGTHVWRSTDGAASWSPLDGSGAATLPDIPVHSVAPDPTRPGRIYLGTDLGIFVSLDGGEHWMSEESGLPSVVTEHVTIGQGAYGPAIYAFTHGRGVWRAELMNTPVRRRAAGR